MRDNGSVLKAIYFCEDGCNALNTVHKTTLATICERTSSHALKRLPLQQAIVF